MTTTAHVTAYIAVALLAMFPSMGDAAPKSSSSKTLLVYIGTYTNGASKGIYAFRFQPATGRATPLGLVAETTSPSFLAIHPSRRFLYAVNETDSFQGQKAGSVSSFAINRKTGKLTLLNQVSSRGAGPCHLIVDAAGKAVLVANYGSGSVAAFPVHPDGRLGEAASFVQHSGSSVNPERQEGPHAHCALASPDSRFALFADLGLDEVLVYRFDPAKASLAPNDPPFGKVNPGAGPRHLAFHPNGKFLYVINEIQMTVTTFGYDSSRGALTELQTLSTVPGEHAVHDSTAEIEVDRAGKFVYGSNRGQNTIAVFAIDAGKGTLTPVEHVPTQGKTPRSFGIDPTGAYLFAANQESDTVVIFKIDPNTGRLAATGQVLEAPKPVCVKFVEAE